MPSQTITPWKVEAENKEDGTIGTIDYDHVIKDFGCQKYTDDLTKELESISGKQAHVFIRRGLTFAHRDFNEILQAAKRGEPFYLYTGRGPSSGSMHLGHAVPFLVCKYFQEVFGALVVIQMTDDEKYLCKDITLEQARSYCKENIKDIIAFGFDPSRTYIFSNYDSSHLFAHSTLKLSKVININEIMKVFGFTLETPAGLIEFPCKQIAPAFATSFPFIPEKTRCLIPAAVDQDPYFRLARDKSFAMNSPKPATLYLCMLPDLQGVNRKMSASDAKSSLFLSDDPETIREKIKRYAFSGGQKTKEMHRELGGNTEVDVAYQYLRFFLDDDTELANIGEKYRRGEIFTGEIKRRCTEVVIDFVRKFQERRDMINDEVVGGFMSCEKFSNK